MPPPEGRDAARGDEAEPGAPRSLSRGSSVSELVRSYDDVSGKRDRSESGDSSAPTGKRGRGGEQHRSPGPRSAQTSIKEHLDNAIEALENKMTVFMSAELHALREIIQSQLEILTDRVSDLERHVDAKDEIIEDLSQQLRESREEIVRIQTRAEEAEIISRLPCLVLSGGAMSPSHARRLQRTAATGPDSAPGQRRSQVTAAGSAGQAGEEGGGTQSRRGGTTSEGPEDVNALVVSTLNQCLRGLNLSESDIDRAHRLPGPNNRVIVRFVRSGMGSKRDEVMWRRLELRGKELFVNESLTPLRSQIFRSLLNARKEEKLHTVYSRGGHVFYKPEKFAAGVRVESLDRVRELGFSVVEGERPLAPGSGGPPSRAHHRGTPARR